jgi:nucleoside-diphosphate-sugar epimerase
MKALVTGGSGYVGRYLTEALLRKGHSVLALDVVRGAIEGRKLEYILGDMADATVVAEAMKDIDVVYHLALIPGDWRATTSNVFDANIKGTLNLLSAANAKTVRHFLHASSYVVYGKPRYLPIDENHPCNPEEGLSTEGPAYPLIKLITEKLCMIYHVQYGLPVTIFRLSLVSGREKPFPRGPLWLQMTDEARRGEMIKVFDNEVSTVVDVDEVADAFLLATLNSKTYGQVFNIDNPNMLVSNYELAKQAVGLAKSESKIKVVEPRGSINTMPLCIEKIQKILGWCPKEVTS